MKTRATDHSRLLCRVVRRVDAALAAPGTSTALAVRHEATCAECRAFFAANAEDDVFAQALRRDARAVSVAAPADLNRRIFAAIADEREPGQSRAVASAVRTWGLALGGVAAGAALAVSIALRTPTSPGRSELVHATPVDGADERTSEVALQWLESLREQPQEAAMKLAEKNPLQREIEAVSADARTVVGFLARNFLPEPTVAGASQPQHAGGDRG